MPSCSQRVVQCARCGESERHAARGLCRKCYWWLWKHGGLDRYPTQPVKGDYPRPVIQPDLVDHAAVERILGGEWRMRMYDPHTRAEVCRRWVRSGRSLRQLERLTGWATHRYYRVREMAS